MNVTVRLFGAFRDAVGEGRLRRELPGGATVDGLWAELAAAWPALGAPDAVRLNAVNLDYAEGARALADGDEVAFFPPVSGG